MNTLLALALLAVAGSVRATEPPPPAAQEQGSAQRLAPELVRLDQVLTMAQRARDEGRFTPERYAEFLGRFRPSLEKARETTPPSPTATALYARILARLGEPQQAADALEPALKERPDDAELRVALGHIRYQQRDYASALAEAEGALAREPGNQAALALKYLSKDRTAGDATPAPSLPPSGMEAPSVLQDPRLVDAGLKSLGRRNALQFTDEAMRRIKIRDPQEALRYLVLAEASDPALPDVPMQQGIAYRELKRHAAAVESFERAETLWRALGTAKSDELADMARSMREHEAATSAPAQAPAESPAKPVERRTPLWPVGAALIAVGLGAAVILEKRRSEAQVRELIDVAGPAGIVLVGAAITAAAMFPPARLVANPGGTATLVEATALARTAAAAYVTKEAASEYVSYSKSQPSSSGSSPDPAQGESKPRSLEDPESLRGATPEEVRALIPEHWERGPMRTGRGEIARFPGTKGNDIVQISQGNPSAPDALHQGPYVKIVRYGKQVRIPLKGNPALK